MTAKRYSWYLPYLKSPSNESKTNTKMDNEQATFWLSQFIGKNLRIHASDGRVFGGQMKCTDKVGSCKYRSCVVLTIAGPQYHLVPCI